MPVAVRCGYTSLVVSFRNDGEAPPSADGRYTLGQSEWRDVEASVQYAVANGATKIVLFGWSLGGAIALRVADQSAYSNRIAGMVLDAPVFDWARTLTQNARASGVPRSITMLGLRMLQSRATRFITGLQDPIEFAPMDWLKRAEEIKNPTLVLHGHGDPSTPFEVSRLIAGLRPDILRLVPFDTVGHSHEWNVDPEKWESAVVGLLDSKHAMVA